MTQTPTRIGGYTCSSARSSMNTRPTSTARFPGQRDPGGAGGVTQHNREVAGQQVGRTRGHETQRGTRSGEDSLKRVGCLHQRPRTARNVLGPGSKDEVTPWTTVDSDEGIAYDYGSHGSSHVPSADQYPRRGRGDDPMQSTGLRQQPGQRRKHRPVRPRQSRSAHLAAQHGDLVTEHKNLRVFRLCAAGEQSEPSHDLPEDQIEQSYRHDRRSCPTAAARGCRRSPSWMTSSAPTASIA
jgi:hypothetical protein